jgi:4-amino-4-deoxy-L-arabinose transferase-like glycosyltransferase
MITLEPEAVPTQVVVHDEPIHPSGRLGRFVRGNPDDPTWTRPALLVLLASTAVLYLWGLSASGWANTYYAAAVQAGSKSWKAMFYGSFDSSNFVTVDKSPAFLWPMEISARIFGLSSWSMLVPQAIEGVATVGLLYAAVRRWFTPGAGLLAGAVLALTPVAAVMFRFNNPDALLVLLLTAGAYAMLRAIEKGSTRWLLFAFSLVGFGFLAKMLQALLVLPAFGLVYLIAAPPSFWTRVRQLALGMVAMIVSAGWWIAIVELTPASARPYIGGSQNNSLLNLIFGYNGFGRLTGNETGSVGGGGQGGTGMWGPTGLGRLFNAQFGGEISWLLPAALVLLVGTVVVTARMPRTNRTRAGVILWGGWLVVTALAISLGKGIIHPYYTVALGPAIGAVIGIGAAVLWARRSTLLARVFLAGAVGVTGWWSSTLLERTPTWQPWLHTPVLVGSLVAAVAILAWKDLRGRSALGVAALALAATLAGPGAYTLATAATPHTGAIPASGPSGFSTGGIGGGGRTALGGGGAGGAAGRRTPPTGVTGGGFRGGPPSQAGGTGGPPTGTAGGAAGGTGGGAGGLLNGSAPSAELVALLQADSQSYTWVAATVGANQAAGYQLGTGDAVMAIGGFNGTDPTPTLSEFQADVAAGKIHYFIAGGARGGFGGGTATTASSGSAITAWVTSNFTATTVGSITLYDLTTTTTSTAT